MPTGYTAAIATGISFRDYALSCARAFGALMDMRDEPADAPIPEAFAPSQYNAERLEKATKRLSELQSMTLEECEAASEKEFTESSQYLKESMKKNADLRMKYEAMLLEVNRYVPPSPDHVEFKRFMADQITSSIEFDCGGSYHQDALDGLVRLPGNDWKQEKINLCLRDIACASNGQKEENERAASRSKWVQQLRGSI